MRSAVVWRHAPQSWAAGLLLAGGDDASSRPAIGCRAVIRNLIDTWRICGRALLCTMGVIARTVHAALQGEEGAGCRTFLRAAAGPEHRRLHSFRYFVKRVAVAKRVNDRRSSGAGWRSWWAPSVALHRSATMRFASFLGGRGCKVIQLIWDDNK